MVGSELGGGLDGGVEERGKGGLSVSWPFLGIGLICSWLAERDGKGEDRQRSSRSLMLVFPWRPGISSVLWEGRMAAYFVKAYHYA